MLEYRIVSREDRTALVQTINDLVSDGWTVQGDLTVTYNPTSDDFKYSVLLHRIIPTP